MIGKKSCQMTEIQKCTLQFDTKTASVEFCQHAVVVVVPNIFSDL